MKKSHIAILSALGLILLVMLMVLIAGRIALGNGRDGRTVSSTGISGHSNTGESRIENYDFEDFSSLTVEGHWDVKIEQDSGYSIEVTYPPSWGEGSALRKTGDALVLGFPEDGEDVAEEAVATVRMPEIRNLRIEGLGSVSFSDFICEDLVTHIEGAAQVTGRDTVVRNLQIVVNGAGQVDYEDLSAVNAEVLLDGAAQVKLLMDGGKLSGRIDGVGRVVYSGEVSAETLTIDGLGRVKYLR